MASTNNLVDYAKLKGWYRTVSKTTTDQINRARETLGRKPPPVDNDTLGSDRLCIESFCRVCEALHQDAAQFVHFMKEFSEREASSLKLSSTVHTAETSCSTKFQNSVEEYASNHRDVAVEVQKILQVVEELLSALSEKIRSLTSVKKSFEHRDRVYQKMLEEDKKWQTAIQTGDVKVVEKRAKSEAATKEMDYVTLQVKEQTGALLSTKDDMLLENFKKLKSAHQGFARLLYEGFCRPDSATPSEDSKRAISPSSPSSTKHAPSSGTVHVGSSDLRVADSTRNPFASQEHPEPRPGAYALSDNNHPHSPTSYELDRDLFGDLDAAPSSKRDPHEAGTQLPKVKTRALPQSTSQGTASQPTYDIDLM